jgi:CubicO group peptidase (beta-lactamase class C family)
VSEKAIVQACERAIAAGQTPGAVVLVGTRSTTLCHIAVGHRAVAPKPLPMRPDTVFDLASVTKPVATATAVMQLVEAGVIGLRDPISRYVPWVDRDGEPQATIRHLLTHTSGLPPWLDYTAKLGVGIADDVERRDAVIADIGSLSRDTRPGERFVYSCLGFITLADIIRRVSGERLDGYCREHIWQPMGMPDTGFNPPKNTYRRCAATEQLPESTLLGVVHDENARFLDGVGGNAGLFSTAGDLSRYCRMILNKGELDGTRVMSPAAVDLMTSRQSSTPRAPEALAEGPRDYYGLGWDIDTDYSPSLRGDLFGPRSCGHTGYTGISIWIDLDLQGFVILLTNRVHFGREVSIQRLRYEVSNIAAAMISREGA